MQQTVGKTFSQDQLLDALHASMNKFPNPSSFEQQAYFEGTYPIETKADPEALRQKFADIEERLQKCVGEPVICIRDGDVTLLYMGIVNSPAVRFWFDQSDLLPNGSASVDVKSFQIAAIVFDDKGGADVEVLAPAGDDHDSYFHFEERGFKEIEGRPQTYGCEESDWELLVGNDEIEQFFGKAKLILPIKQGLITDPNVIEATARDISDTGRFDR